MFTDMVGSTASAQDDEATALRVRAQQQRLVRPVFASHQGREVKSMGDGFLVEFESALQGVLCAIEIQQMLHEHNLSAPDASKIRLRIGIHLGDVVHEGDDVVGDSVNVASRIEALADPGGICITDPVFGQVRNKIPNGLEKLESKTLKNVRFPTEVYRVVLPWNVRKSPSVEFGQIRLAVLPFSSISPDVKDEYFADGLTEELITVISQLRDLQVIARTSVMPYKSSSKSVSQIGSELAVNSVLEGSVRKAGDRLRITAQLISTDTEAHLWAKSYDKRLDDVFEVQSDIAKQVAEALKIELHSGEKKRFDARPLVGTDSYLAYLKGQALLHDAELPQLKLAQELFERAITLDPDNAAAHSSLGLTLREIGSGVEGGPPAEWDSRSRQLVARAIELDPNLAEAHVSLAGILWSDFDFEGANQEFRHAISLNPSDARARRWYGRLLLERMHSEEGLAQLRLAEVADPLSRFTLFELIYMLTWLGKRDEAWACFEKYRDLNPPRPALLGALVWFYLDGPDHNQATTALKDWLESLPDQSSRETAVLRAWAWTMSGQLEKARAVLHAQENLPEIPQLDWYMSMVYAQAGDLDASFRWLARAIDHHLVWIEPFLYFSYLEPMRKDPRFRSALKRMNLD